MKKYISLLFVGLSLSLNAAPCPSSWASKSMTIKRQRLIEYQLMAEINKHGGMGNIVGWSVSPLGDFYTVHYHLAPACDPKPCEISFRYSKPCGLDLKAIPAANPN